MIDNRVTQLQGGESPPRRSNPACSLRVWSRHTSRAGKGGKQKDEPRGRWAEGERRGVFVRLLTIEHEWIGKFDGDSRDET
jgi:hypothetical protein